MKVFSHSISKAPADRETLRKSSGSAAQLLSPAKPQERLNAQKT